MGKLLQKSKCAPSKAGIEVKLGTEIRELKMLLVSAERRGKTTTGSI